LIFLASRSVVLGHTLRGAAPCAADRVLATRLGHKAIGLLASGKVG
jgi:6-phosphofructokinase 1